MLFGAARHQPVLSAIQTPAGVPGLVLAVHHSKRFAKVGLAKMKMLRFGC